MAGNIFINYRRGESSHVAGRLHERLAQTFGRDKLFMDVDNIPVGFDFEDHLKNQVAECDAMLSVIDPNWLDAKDETGRRRLDNPEDFVAIEIAAALARGIPVIPVLVDGARMPKASDLPDTLKALARRNAVQIRHTNFGSDADALTKKMREALGHKKSGRDRWRLGQRALVAAAIILVSGALTWFGLNVLSPHAPPVGLTGSETAAPTAPEKTVVALGEPTPSSQAHQSLAEAKGKAEETEGRRLAVVKAEQERQVRAADEEAKRKAEGIEQERLAALKAGEERRHKAFELLSSGKAYLAKDDLDRAIADFDEAIRLNPQYSVAFFNRAFAYNRKADRDRAIADYDEAIRLDPKNATALNNRGVIYKTSGDMERALADLNEALRVNPEYALALCNRGWVKLAIGDLTGRSDIEKAKQLDPAQVERFCRSRPPARPQ